MDERDAWIRREAQSLSESLEHKRKQMTLLHQDVENVKVKVTQQEQDVKVCGILVYIACHCWRISSCVCLCVCEQERSEDLEQRKVAIDRVNREHAQLKLRRDDLTNERK